jgi:hypothetical protein
MSQYQKKKVKIKTNSMGFLGKKKELVEKKVTTSSSLREQSSIALSTFQKVLEDLRGINEKSARRRESLILEVERISLEVQDLEGINKDN